MKKFTSLLLFLLLTLMLQAQEEKTVSSRITDVTVYLRGAQVNSIAYTNLPSGVTEIVFDQISGNVDEGSLQVSARGDFLIQSVTYRINYLKQQQRSKDVATLEDSIETVEYQLARLGNRQYAMNEELSMILSNKQVKGQNALDPIDVEDMAEFFRRRITEVKNLLLELSLQEKKLKKDLQRLKQQLNTKKGGSARPIGEIVVKVSANRSTSATFTLSYYTPQAGWNPMYDLRAENIQQPVKVVYKAEIYQNTGVDWQDVKLTLSTGSPSQGGNKPDLNPWYLNFQQHRPPTPRYNIQKQKRADGMELEADEEAPAAGMYDHTTVAETQLNMEFRVDLPQTLRSGNQRQQVTMQQYEIPAKYHYVAVPKLDNDAFLVANITDWAQYNLLPGNANLFLEGTFVGKSYLDPKQTGDTLTLSFGRDKKIVVERKQVKQKESTSFLGSKKQQVFEYEIIVRNTKSQEADIHLQDQIPVSQNSDITVDLENKGGANLDAGTGILSWRFTLAPAESKKVNFRYKVSYPKDKVIPSL